MPTYDYQCKTCGKRFEYFQSITSDALTQCPADLCGAEDPELRGKGEVQRLVSGGAGLVFKGEGFYLTDYARKGKKSGSSSSSSTSISGGSSSESSGSSGSGGGEKGTSSSTSSSESGTDSSSS